MSKELIEQLLSEWQRMHSDFAYRPAPKLITEAADRIEELEREVERKMSAADFILKERDALQADRDEWEARAEFSYRQRDELNRLCEFNEKTMSALQADNARLREALEHSVLYVPDLATVPGIAAALSATPEQSLARIRNQVKEECAETCEEYQGSAETCARAIRATKELQ